MNDVNPFQAPQTITQKQHGPDDPIRPADALRVPAIGLIIISPVSLVVAVTQTVVGMGSTDGSWIRHLANNPEALGVFVGGLFPVLFNLITLMGGIYMIKGVQYKTCRSAALVASIPCFSPCVVLGMVFGIWSLVLLRKPEIKAGFTS